MVKLEEIKEGIRLSGLAAGKTVTVVTTKRYGENALEVTYKDDGGELGGRILYRDAEAGLSLQEKNRRYGFDGDGEKLRLVLEAYRIKSAYLFDPYLAVHTSSVEPLPHQISAVYEEMLPRQPLRYILADDPGSGKTVMTGLLIKELIARGDVKRCLVVCPGSLCEQWQDELYQKFNLRFAILTNDGAESAVTGNVFSENDFCIARLDKLSRDDALQGKLKVTEWDLIVVDEAHKMSAYRFGKDVKYTKRFLLGRLLSKITRHFLLLTATPHSGKEEDFRLFLSLVDADRFEGVERACDNPIDVSGVMRRLVKEDLLKFDGSPLFPERMARTVDYGLSQKEAELYDAVTNYVREEFNRADALTNERRNTVGFALTVLQRRLASSPEAIFQSLRRRRERLENRLTEERLGVRAAPCGYGARGVDLDYDDDDVPRGELEDMEENIVDEASAAETVAEMEAEIKTLRGLEETAARLRASGEDRKWSELSKLLQDDGNMFSPDAGREKLIIFTEHRDTLRYLENKINALLGRPGVVVSVHGGLRRDERRKAEELFKQNAETRILIATDAAGEGVNLQCAHLMVNYDLPWNPNRLEQRFGRIHRIGQTKTCYLWNLVARETREGDVFRRLFEKLEEERRVLGGKVFDVLGKISFGDRPLRDLLIEAVRCGGGEEGRLRVRDVVNRSLDREKLVRLIEENALTADCMDVSRVMEIREEMERAEARKLQPHFMEAFFLKAFETVGGRARKRENGRYELSFVPSAIRNSGISKGCGKPILKKYERVCFDKERVNMDGLPQAEIICPGRPLLDATVDLIISLYGGLSKRGAVFIDEADRGSDARLLFCMEDAVCDEAASNGKRRVISKNIGFVEIKEDGSAKNAGYAPHLDYRAATAAERTVALEFASKRPLLSDGVEERAVNHAVSEILPRRLELVKSRKEALLNKTERAVKKRLTAEIRYWDAKANDLKEEENAGKAGVELNSSNARKRADNLEARLQKRLAEIERERNIFTVPPVVVGCALVIPGGLLAALTESPGPPPDDEAKERRAVELAAMNAVMDIERSLGFLPKDVSADKCGYDIESAVPKEKRNGGPALRMIEVKGRRKGATSVTVSKNEIMTALNRPEEYILAVVEVDGANTHTRYLRKPFCNKPDFAATGVNYDLPELLRASEMILERERRE